MRILVDEVQMENRREQAAPDLDRELRRYVRDIARQIETMETEVEHRIQSVLEWLGLPVQMEPTAIDDHLQEGLREDVHVGREIRNKGQRQTDMLDPVFLTEQVVVESDRAIV